MKELETRKKDSLKGKILGTFRLDRDFPKSSTIQGGSVHVNIAPDYYSRKSVGKALSETELKRAEALTEKQRHSFLC